MKLTTRLIQERIAEEVSEALSSINGPTISPDDVEVIGIVDDFTDPSSLKIRITLPFHAVEDDNYIGICAY